jgi:hypothetical protein
MRYALDSYIPGLSEDVLKLPMHVVLYVHAHGRAWRAVQELHGARPMQTSKRHLLRQTMDSWDVL